MRVLTLYCYGPYHAKVQVNFMVHFREEKNHWSNATSMYGAQAYPIPALSLSLSHSQWRCDSQLQRALENCFAR